jgi:hypothetical protein
MKFRRLGLTSVHRADATKSGKRRHPRNAALCHLADKQGSP